MRVKNNTVGLLNEGEGYKGCKGRINWGHGVWEQG